MKLKNITGVPISFEGVNGTIRFMKSEVKDINDTDITPSLKEGIDNGSLLVMAKPEVKAEAKVEEGTDDEVRKTNKIRNRRIEDEY